MKHGLLAAAFLVASAGFASADYVVIVANVGGSQEELKTPLAGMAGIAGIRGMQPGLGGIAGMRGMQPGLQQPGAGGQAGMRPGMMGGMQPGMGGMMRGMQPGMGGTMRGMQGGMAGMGGMRGVGMMRGMMGGGMIGGMAASLNADDLPHFVLAVVEVKPTTKKNMVQYFKVQDALPEQARTPLKVQLPERLGVTCYLLKKPSFGEMYIITEGKEKPLPTVSQRYKEEYEKVMKGTPGASDYLHMARWALEHGMVQEFAQVMDKLAEIDKTHPAAIAYLKIKADLDRPATNDPSSTALSSQLLSKDNYKTTETPHYLIVHSKALTKGIEKGIKNHFEHLENTFRGFYYWFALKQQEAKQPLPTVPRNRQVVIVTSEKKDFDGLKQMVTAGPVVVDGFFARRENLVVMTSQRQDDRYEALKTYWKTWQEQGYDADGLLESKSVASLPKSAVPLKIKAAGMAALTKIAEAQMLALMLKALEQEAALATVSHDASRQLLFASGLLPRNVAVPEWLLFGMGSFFETPLEAPWPTIAAPSPYYLPRWRELRSNNELEKTRLETLRKVVTDGYFRTLPPDKKDDNDVHLLHEAALRKARTVSWSLTYFLAQRKFDGLRQYFAELSKMPRDLELDDAVLLGCFARAFGCVDANNKVNDTLLKNLASEWFGYWDTVNFESEPIMKEIRETILKKQKEEEEKLEKQQNNNNGTQPGMFPGAPGGLPPGGRNSPRGPGGGGPGY